MFRYLRRVVEERKVIAKARFLDEARGHIVSTWAFIESCLDQANHLGWQLSGGTIQKVVPVNFNRKIALFKQLHVDLALFQPLRDQAADLLGRLQTFKDDRHYLVHGFCEPDAREWWVLTKHLFEKDGSISVVQRRFTREQLWNLRIQVLDIEDEVGRYTNALLVEFDKHKANNGGG